MEREESMNYTAMTLASVPSAQHLTQKPHGIQFGTFVVIALIIWACVWLFNQFTGGGRH